MPIEFHCPHCDKFLRTPEDKAGVRANCPGCGEPITIPPGKWSGLTPLEPETRGGPGGPAEIDAQHAAQGEPGATRLCPMCGETIDAAAIRCRYCGEAFQTGLLPAAAEVRERYAGFWLRFAAWFLDGMIMLVPNSILHGIIVLIGVFFSDRGNSEIVAIATQLISALASMVTYWLYFALMESSALQGTLGKLALEIKVTDLDGQRISFGQATGRFFGKYLSLCLYIGFFVAAFTEKKQALHDILARCLIVRKSSTVS